MQSVSEGEELIPDFNEYVQTRIAKVERLKEQGKNPYENRVRRDLSIADFRDRHANLLNGGDRDENAVFYLVGRVKLLRVMGKAAFATIEDQSGSTQLFLSLNDLGESYNELKKLIDVGDIVQASGYGFVTKTGELSLHIKSIEILTKSIRPLPEKFHGVQDIELRSRQRYLDLIMNPSARENFILRSKIISTIRGFFEKNGFLEVETPMLHPIPGGANAKPFITRHNALNVNRYLRIAPELYLKRLIAGGFEAIYELNRNFRNEGMDSTHNPEFTTIEFYWAYKTYEDLIKLTEKLFAELSATLKINEVNFKGQTIRLKTPFARYSYDEALTKIGGIDSAALNDREKLVAISKQNAIEIKKDRSIGAIKAELFDVFVEGKLIDPTFIVDFPIEVSPLARRSDQNPEIADRFELFIGGYEIANGFSELNDPIDQFERFKAQVAAKEAGDEEGMYMDEDYVTALSYGMPPTAGEGIGIDRLVMILLGFDAIREVLLFPAMKPERTKE
ncbi:MAG: lysine--tRNA ligase [Helicobacteraceae bacterium]|jgi:lysyl-tRNA synthetase class 2|nr:lysine--tRNA ligase [Helicobacteraceae bacterium]